MLKRHSIDQCTLYKTQSKARLVKILFTSTSRLAYLFANTANYRKFTIPPKDDPFSTPRKERPAQEPKYELRRIHERILYLIKGIEAPTYLHSAIKGRSHKTNAAAHLCQDRLVKLDIRRFFPSTTESRVFQFFTETLGCAPDISKILAKLCTCDGVLPTGSPLSPLLSYYANKPMFDELAELARSRGLVFTCYIDDLTFSGTSLSRGFFGEVELVVRKYGHAISQEKSRFYSLGAIAEVTGVMVTGGRLLAPNARFRKVRSLDRAIAAEGDISKKLHLVERLNGLIGEAAHIEPRFRVWAKSVREKLTRLRRHDKSIAV